MSEVVETVLGLTAGGLTTISFLPQVLQTWKTKSAKDLNLSMFILLTVGISMWLVYGLYIGKLPVIAANVVGLFSASTILYFKLRYG
ncbi:MAG: SemiSWEET transporter [Planctomycetota bacterium]|jgi:MtN3 and saliva related transmembrane protein